MVSIHTWSDNFSESVQGVWQAPQLKWSLWNGTRNRVQQAGGMEVKWCVEAEEEMKGGRRDRQKEDIQFKDMEWFNAESSSLMV